MAIGLLLASVFQLAFGETSVSARDGSCTFANLAGRIAIGASSEQLELALGESTMGQFDGERSWGIAKADFGRVGLRAEGVNQAVIRTLNGRVFALELIYEFSRIDYLRHALEARLDLCAKPVSPSCWKDESGNYYVLVSNSAGLMLAYGNPTLSSPSEREGPARCRSGG